ncbi:hypothetical protein CRV03_06985 [Arcobacter sp. F155]|nr:hypothetical protein CRV03_06985 [Arcobacter sp. F155]
MHDSEFIAELVIAIDKGITSKSQPAIESLYKKYNEVFEESRNYERILMEFFDFINSILIHLRETTIVKSYVIHSLFCAFLYIRDELKDSNFNITNHHISDDEIVRNLSILADAHELHDEDGRYRDYVSSCSARTTNAPQRTIRTEYLIRALTGNL